MLKFVSSLLWLYECMAYSTNSTRKQYAQTSTSLNLNHLSFILRPSIAPKFKTFLFFMTCIYLNFTFWLHFSKENQYFITCTDSSDFLAHASTFWSETSASIRALSTSTGRSVIDATVVEPLQNPSFFLLQSFEFFELCLWYFAQNFRLLYFAKHKFCKTWISSSCDKKKDA